MNHYFLTLIIRHNILLISVVLLGTKFISKIGQVVQAGLY